MYIIELALYNVNILKVLVCFIRDSLKFSELIHQNFYGEAGSILPLLGWRITAFANIQMKNLVTSNFSHILKI